MTARFGSVITAMTTPFPADGSLDLARAEELATWLLDHGTEGLVVAGSTGAGGTLSGHQKNELGRTVARPVAGRRTKAPVIAGTGTYDTAHSIPLTKEAAKAGVDAALVVTPY